MCIGRIKNWAKLKVRLQPLPLELPYPEEAEDPSITIENINFQRVRRKWFEDYKVPKERWGYWVNGVEVILGERYVPAASSGLTKRLWLCPRWANSGVLAHEYAHISYSFLTREQKAEFGAKFDIVKDTDELLNFAYMTKSYMSTKRIEAHADTYRYLGNQMPEELKEYYPKLLF